MMLLPLVILFLGYYLSPHKCFVYIPLPTPCHVIERVEENRIYLSSPDFPCVQVIKNVPVMLSSEYEKVFIYIDGKLYMELKNCNGSRL